MNIARKGLKYQRKIFVTNKNDAEEVVERLKDFDPYLLDDIIRFRATKDEFAKIKEELGLICSEIILSTKIHRAWMYRKEES